MKISEHIKTLLFEHECVIIPSFGGFIGKYKEAKVDFSTSKLHPPVKLIAFNQSLKENDGLLLNHISKTDQISYQEAETIISDYVSRMNSALNGGKKVKLPEIGNFSLHKGKLFFDPENKINFHADAFGLDSFDFPMLNTNGKQRITPIKQLEPVKSKKKRPALIPLLVGLPLVAALSYMPVFFQSNEQIPGNETAGISIPIKIKAHKAEATELNIPNKTLELKENTTSTQFTSTQTVGSIHIIGGSFSTYDNAEKAMTEFKALGYNASVLPTSKGMNRVAIKSYNNIDEASADLNKIRKALGNQNLWILQ